MLAGILIVAVFAIGVALWGGLLTLRRPAPRRPRLWLQTPQPGSERERWKAPDRHPRGWA